MIQKPALWYELGHVTLYNRICIDEPPLGDRIRYRYAFQLCLYEQHGMRCVSARLVSSWRDETTDRTRPDSPGERRRRLRAEWLAETFVFTARLGRVPRRVRMSRGRSVPCRAAPRRVAPCEVSECEVVHVAYGADSFGGASEGAVVGGVCLVISSGGRLGLSDEPA